MQGPLGDIGRHGDYLGDTGRHRDSKTINCRNLIKGAMQGPLGDIGRHRH